MSSNLHEESPSLALRARVLTRIATTPSMTRRQGRALGWALVLASIAVAAVIFQSIGGLAHAAKRPFTISLALASGWTVIAIALSWLVLGKRQSAARSPMICAVAALAAPVLLFGWMDVFSGTYIEPFTRVGYRCFAYTLLIAALPLGSFLLLRRAIEPRAPAALGAAAGAACAAWGGVVIDLWCPLTNAPHVLVGHVAPLVTAIVVGATLGRHTLGVRAFAQHG